jgi:hypothetical protein
MTMSLPSAGSPSDCFNLAYPSRRELFLRGTAVQGIACVEPSLGGQADDSHNVAEDSRFLHSLEHAPAKLFNFLSSEADVHGK